MIIHRISINNRFPGMNYNEVNYANYPLFPPIKETVDAIMNELRIEEEPDYSDIMRDTLYDTHDRKILFSRGI
jgi:hypothetical protein